MIVGRQCLGTNAITMVGPPTVVSKSGGVSSLQWSNCATPFSYRSAVDVAALWRPRDMVPHGPACWWALLGDLLMSSTVQVEMSYVMVAKVDPGWPKFHQPNRCKATARWCPHGVSFHELGHCPLAHDKDVGHQINVCTSAGSQQPMVSRGGCATVLGSPSVLTSEFGYPTGRHLIRWSFVGPQQDTCRICWYIRSVSFCCTVIDYEWLWLSTLDPKICNRYRI